MSRIIVSIHSIYSGAYMFCYAFDSFTAQGRSYIDYLTVESIYGAAGPTVYAELLQLLRYTDRFYSE